MFKKKTEYTFQNLHILWICVYRKKTKKTVCLHTFLKYAKFKGGSIFSFTLLKNLHKNFKYWYNLSIMRYDGFKLWCIKGEKQCRLWTYLFHSKVPFPDFCLALMIQFLYDIQVHHPFLYFLLWVDYKNWTGKRLLIYIIRIISK